MDEVAVAAIGALADSTRRRAYELVSAAPEPVGRDDVAAALAIGRTLAAFHLDKLAELGLLDVTFARPSGRTGPGAGRPAKLYHVAPRDIEVSLPPRAYSEMAVLLAEALDRSGNDRVAADVARSAGVVAGRAVARLAPVAALTERGYAPRETCGTITLRNCPFDVVAHEFPPLICGMNLALLDGLVGGAGWDYKASMDSAPGRCCVKLTSINN